MVIRYRPKVGIYRIRNRKNGKCYVGSAVNIPGRWVVHKCHLLAGRHHSQKLQRAWDKYGQDAFAFEVLEVCARDEAALTTCEQYWMDKLEVVAHGYNVEPNARTPLGRKWSLQSRKKLSQSAKRLAAAPSEKLRRSERAKRQHAAGKLGRATWKPGTDLKVNCLVSQKAKDSWADPVARERRMKSLRSADRTKQSAYLRGLGSAEMSRRSFCRSRSA